MSGRLLLAAKPSLNSASRGRIMSREDDDEEWVPDEDDPSLEDLAEQDAIATIPCPYCHEPVHEDSQRCPHCETYISQEDAPPSRKPVWIIVGLLITLAIAVMWALGR